MLVLTRKVGEEIMIGDGIVVTVLESRHDGIRIGIKAQRTVPIHRGEVVAEIAAANRAAANVTAEAVAAMLGAAAPAAS